MIQEAVFHLFHSNNQLFHRNKIIVTIVSKIVAFKLLILSVMQTLYQ